MPQIRAAWQMGHGGGATKAHKNFTDQMAIKTVINRACKLYISTSDDGGLVDGKGAYNTDDPSKEDKKEKIKEKAHKKDLQIDDAEVVDDGPGQVPEPQEELEPEERPENQTADQGTIGPGF